MMTKGVRRCVIGTLLIVMSMSIGFASKKELSVSEVLSDIPKETTVNEMATKDIAKKINNITKTLKFLGKSPQKEDLKTYIDQHKLLNTISVSSDLKTVNDTIFFNASVGKAIVKAQNKIAAILLNYVLRKSFCYSQLKKEQSDNLPTYNYTTEKNSLAGPYKPKSWQQQIKEIMLVDNNTITIEAQTKILPSSIIFRYKDDIANTGFSIFSGEPTKGYFISDQKKGIVQVLTQWLNTIQKIYATSWSFDKTLRDHEHTQAIIDDTFNLLSFNIDEKDFTDIKKVLNPSLRGFNTYFKNIYTATRILAWAHNVINAINPKQNVKKNKRFEIYFEDLKNKIKELKEALDIYTGPEAEEKTEKELLDAIKAIASVDGEKKLYDVNTIQELSGGALKDVVEDFIVSKSSIETLALQPDVKTWLKTWLKDDPFNDPEYFLKDEIATTAFIKSLTDHITHSKKKVFASENLESYLAGFNDKERADAIAYQMREQYKNDLSKATENLIASLNSNDKQKTEESLEKAKEWVQKQLEKKNLDKNIQEAAKNFLSNPTPTTIKNLHQTIQKYLEKKQIGIPLEDNLLRKKIARKWIRNAAIRIFDDPLRAFLEVVVNALDATSNKFYKDENLAVGKFGMGFFSILSFLWKIPESAKNDQELMGSKITIRCLFKENENASDEPYKIIFTRVPDPKNPSIDHDDIAITFKKIHKTILGKVNPEYRHFMQKIKKLEASDSVKPNPTGTVITIEPINKNKRYSQREIEILKNYAKQLQFHPLPTKIIQENAKPFIVGGTKKDRPLVIVTLTPQKIEVADAGLSMNVQTILTKLLIPSTSTKRGLADLEQAQGKALNKLADLDKKEDKELNKLLKNHVVLTTLQDKEQGDESSYFVITVNNVTVVKRKLSKKIIDEQGQTQDIIIHMPQETQLTLARNELSIAQTSEKEKNFEKDYLKGIIDLAITTVAKGVDQKNNKLILPLFQGLQEWELQSAAHHIQGIFSNYVKYLVDEKIMKSPNLIPIPEQYVQQTKMGDSKSLLPFNHEIVNYNFTKFENYLGKYSYKEEIKQLALKIDKNLLQDALDFKLIAGFRIIFLPDAYLTFEKDETPKMSTLGLRRTIFAPESILKESKTRKNVVNALLRFGDQELQPAQEHVKEIKDQANFILTANTDYYPESSVYHYFAYMGAEGEHTIFSMNKKEQKCSMAELPQKIKGEEVQRKIREPYNDVKVCEKIYGYFPDLLLNLGFGRNAIKNKKNLFFNDEPLLPEINDPGKLYACLSLFYYFSQEADDNILIGDENDPEPFLSWGKAAKTGSIRPVLFFTDGLDSSLARDAILKQENKNELFWLFGKEEKLKKDFILFKDWNRKEILDLSLCFQEMIPLLTVLHEQTSTNNPFNLSETTYASLKSLNDSIWGIYENCLNPDPSLFTTIYGRFKEKHFIKFLSTITGTRFTKQSFFDDFLKYYERTKITNYDTFKTMLEYFEKNKSVETISKLFSFQITDFINKVSSQFQRETLFLNDRMIIPTFFGNTPLFMVFAFLKTPQAPLSFSFRGKMPFFLDITKKVIETCQSPEIFDYVFSILLNKKILSYLYSQKKEDFTSTIAFIEYAIKSYIQTKIPLEDINQFYKKLCTLFKADEYLENLVPEVVVKNFLSILKLQKTSYEKTESLPETLHQLEKKQQPQEEDFFPLSKLLIAHTHKAGLQDLLKDYKLQEVIEKAKAITDEQAKNFELGKITQCIEAGSEKNATEATAIEALQNSIDAIRGLYTHAWDKTLKDRNKNDDYKKDFATITYILGIKEVNEKQASLAMSIKDEVGFDTLSRLLSDLVLPDFSNKAPQAGSIGDMGNGSFKMYQDAEQVSFLTRLTEDPNKFYLLIIKPNRSAQKVTELELACKDISEYMLKHNNDFWGTEIKIIFQSKPATDTHINFITTQSFLRNCIGTTHAYLDTKKEIPFQCLLKTKKNESPELLNPIDPQNHIFDHTGAYLSNKAFPIFEEAYKARIPKSNEQLTHEILKKYVLFRISKQNDPARASYLLTSGIPFRPLTAVIRENSLLPLDFLDDLAYGYVVDVDTVAYEPVQSRARLNMHKELEKELKRALFESYFIIGLKTAEEEEIWTQEQKKKEEEINKKSFTSKEKPEEQTEPSRSQFRTAYFLHFASRINDFSQLTVGSPKTSLSFQQTINRFIEKSTDTSINLKQFFCFYQPYSSIDFPLKSFYDYIDYEIENKTSIKDLISVVTEVNKVKSTIKNEANNKKDIWVIENQEKFQELIEKQNLIINTEKPENQKTKLSELDAPIKELLSDFYKNITSPFSKKLDKELDEITKRWKKENALKIANPIGLLLFNNVIVPWFSEKIKSIRLDVDAPAIEVKTAKTSTTQKSSFTLKTSENVLNDKNIETLKNDATGEERNKVIPHSAFMGTLIKTLFSEFIKISYRKNNPLAKKDLPTKIYFKVSGTLGFYSQSQHNININSYGLQIDSIIDFILRIYTMFSEQLNMNVIKKHPAYIAYFAPKLGAASPFIHELEHANTRSNHENKASHHESFDKEANGHGFDAINKGLLDEWCNAVYNEITKTDDYKNIIETIKKEFPNIRKTKNDNLAAALDLMGK